MRILLLFLVLFGPSLAVNRNDFKTCEQSSFCKRHRSLTTSTGYTVVPGSSSTDQRLFKARLKNADNELELRVQLLSDSRARLQIDEPADKRIRERFIPTIALDGEPEVVAHQATIGPETAVIEGGPVKLVVHFSPFRVDFYEGGELIIQLNEQGKLKVEEFRQKEDGKEYPEGFWEEHWKSWRDSKPHGSSSVGLDVSFTGFAHGFGLAEHADAFSLRSTRNNGDPFRLYNLDVFEYEIGNPMALYAAIPYIVAHRANRTAGILWFNAAETWVDTWSTAAEKSVIAGLFDSLSSHDSAKDRFGAHFISETGLVDVFLFAGPKPGDVSRQYAATSGVQPIPPLFSIGYHQCRWNYKDEADVQQVNENYDKYDIPMDVIWLDIEHTDGKKYFTWDGRFFPDSKRMIDNVAARGRKMVTIIDPHIKRDTNYYIFKEATDLGLFVRNREGTADFEGNCWPGPSSYLDFLNPKTRDWWTDQFSLERYQGSTKDLWTWNDMNEPSVFSGPEITMDKDSVHHGGVEHRDLHNIYGLLYHQTSFQGLLKRSAGRDRPFLLTRSGFVGSQRSAALWTGDNTAEWSHLAASVPMLLSLSVNGWPFIGADVGGFFKNPDEQLLARWYQAGAFQPFFRGHAHIETKRREPWLFSETTKLSIRSSIRQRYELLPYWYTAFAKHARAAEPVLRPVWWEFPTQVELFAEEKTWLVGDALLVRPVLEEGGTTVQLTLPGNSTDVWYEWRTSSPKVHRAGQLSGYPAPIEGPVPAFQRGGSIIPVWNRIRRAATLMRNDPITLEVALSTTGSAKGELYLDDAQTHDYRDRGEYALWALDYRTDSRGNGVLRATREGTFEREGNWLEKVILKGVARAPRSVQLVLDGKRHDVQFKYDSASRKLVLRRPAAPFGNAKIADWRLELSA